MKPLQIIPGLGGLPKALLVAPDGAQAEVYLHGGQLTSWIPATGSERLYLSPNADFGPSSTIRGGVPVVFPQFSSLGPLRKHGFARLQPWEAQGAEIRAGLLTSIFTLSENQETLQEWPHPFQVELAVTLGGNRLNLTLSITNSGSEAFRFSAALHTYLRVSDISRVQVEGLKDNSFTDHTAGNGETRQTEKLLSIEGEIDRIYYNPRPVLTLHDEKHTLHIARRGFSDYVIWNPGPTNSAALSDLGPDGYRSFLCVEAALIGKPVRLSPEESWQGTQTLTTMD